MSEENKRKVKFPDTWLCDLVNDYNFPSPVVEDAQEEESSDKFFKVFKHFIDTRRASESRIKHLMVDCAHSLSGQRMTT